MDAQTLEAVAGRASVEPIHWISANPNKAGNATACGRQLVFPMRGNCWRVRDITCPDCDRAICDALRDHLLSKGEGTK